MTINPFKTSVNTDAKSLQLETNISRQLTEIINRLACMDNNVNAIYEKIEFIEALCWDILPDEKKLKKPPTE